LVHRDVKANRIAAANLLRRALAGDPLEHEPDWPDDSDDESVETALSALDEYLNDIPRDDIDQEYWRLELGRMADALSRGEALDREQLSGWKGIDITRLVWLIAAVALAFIVRAARAGVVYEGLRAA